MHAKHNTETSGHLQVSNHRMHAKTQHANWCEEYGTSMPNLDSGTCQLKSAPSDCLPNLAVITQHPKNTCNLKFRRSATSRRSLILMKRCKFQFWKCKKASLIRCLITAHSVHLICTTLSEKTSSCTKPPKGGIRRVIMGRTRPITPELSPC